MPNYKYTAINESGATVSDTIEAETSDIATTILQNRGFILEKIKEEGGQAGKKGGMFQPGVTISDLILFTKQMRTMMLAGVPIMRLFQVLETQTQNKTLKSVISAISNDIRSGSTLQDAFANHPKVFSTLYVSMIRAGEVSGTVPDILHRLTYIIEHEAKIKADIKSALQYPMTVLIALGVAFFVLLTFVIPKFIAIFTKAGLTLPLPTKICMALYTFMSAYWALIIGGVVALVIGLRTYFKTTQGALVRDSTLLKLPIFGTLFQKAAMSRFASIFAILQRSGVPVMQTMEILIGTIGNAAIALEFSNLRDKMEQGQGISAPLRSSTFFPPMVIDMIAIGEESGNIEEMMQVVSAHYDEEVEYAVKGLSDLIVPILTVGLAGVVGFFALAIFLPMWDLTKMVKK